MINNIFHSIQSCLLFTTHQIVIISLIHFKMESSPPPNLANLNMLFNEYDTDQDGQVNDEQIEKIFHQIGFTDVYTGTIRKVIRLMNIHSPQLKRLNFIQLEEYANAMITKGKFKIWKQKLGFQENIKECFKDIYGEQQNAAGPGGAGPGNAPTPTSSKYVNSQEGEVLVNVGNTAAYSQFLNISLQKQTGQQIKPFAKISVERNNQEQAMKIEALFKQMYNTVIEMLKVEQQELISQILSVSFITSVNNNVFNLFITTANESLIELVQLFTGAMDQVLKNPINGKMQGSFKFDFDFQKFISDPSYNFYDIMVKNSSLHLKWNFWEFFNALRKLTLAGKFYEDLQYEETDEFCLFLIGLLHCQRFVGKMEFNNTSSEGHQLQSKKYMKQFFNQMKNSLSQFGSNTGMPALQMVSQLDGKVSIELGVKDWRLNIQAQLKNFVKLLTETIEEGQVSEEYGSGDEVDQQLIAQVGPGMVKSSSLKKIKKHPTKDYADSGSQSSQGE